MKAAIFDMDGLLIDSEPLWREAEVSVFRDLGVPLTTDMCRETIGIRVDGVVRHWFDRFPWQGVSLATVESKSAVRRCREFARPSRRSAARASYSPWHLRLHCP
jgi:beta-phosphoglucomutase-like phosphatase (HAD superfamily)